MLPDKTTDRLILALDRALRTVCGTHTATTRPNPARDIPEAELSERERTEVARLVRVDHAGEVCAQALYQGQALTARQGATAEALSKAADEEVDHLVWCEERLRELGSRTSFLSPFWYAGSFLIGAAAGLAGDRVNLGFLAETERQVTAHLEGHLARLPGHDAKSRAILELMRDDEQRHATTALDHGGAELPEPVRGLMRLASRVMTGTAHWI